MLLEANVPRSGHLLLAHSLGLLIGLVARSLFTDHFGSNPNTPYMWLALPAFGYFLPSPMWHMKRQDVFQEAP